MIVWVYSFIIIAKKGYPYKSGVWVIITSPQIKEKLLLKRSLGVLGIKFTQKV